MKLFIGCSSRDDLEEEYYELSRTISNLVQSHEVIVGGTSEGMMREVTKSLSSSQVKRIVLNDYLTEDYDIIKNHVIPCNTSFERLKRIWNMADVFLILPGGTGTLEELLAFLEENRTQEKRKKIILFNYHHFYDGICDFVRELIKKRFSNEEILTGFIVVETLEDLQLELER